MIKFDLEKQIKRLYGVTTIGFFQIAGASWVALLAMRGFSLLEIGIMESIFHMVSMCFEIPSGVAADVFGRRKTLILSQAVSFTASILMILSKGFWSTSLAIGFSALSYNLSSGTREALAYDSLKYAGREEEYNRFASTEMMLYRISNATATLCAGLSLFLGFQKAYAVDAVFSLGAVIVALGLKEVTIETECNKKQKKETISWRLKNVILESIRFLSRNRKARIIMIVNSFIGAVATLVLFFLQAKLPMAGLNNALLGPALFIMGLGAALGAKMVSYFPKSRYEQLLVICTIGVGCAFSFTFTRNVWVMIVGGFVGAFSDDFIQVRTDVILNEMIPSEQRATLVSVASFLFSVVMIVMSTFMGWVFEM